MPSAWFIASPLRASMCNNVIYCRNIHISLCGNGCSWHWNVEDDQIKVLILFCYNSAHSYHILQLVYIQIVQLGFKWIYIDTSLVKACMLYILHFHMVYLHIHCMFFKEVLSGFILIRVQWKLVYYIYYTFIWNTFAYIVCASKKSLKTFAYTVCASNKDLSLLI